MMIMQVFSRTLFTHCQDAGTHSGDATLLLPSQRLHLETHRRVMHIAAQLPGTEIAGHSSKQGLSLNFNGRTIKLNQVSTKSD